MGHQRDHFGTGGQKRCEYRNGIAFLQKLGLDSFQELKLELMRSVASVHAESKNEDQWIDEENNWQQIMAKMGACYQQAIAKTMEGIDTHRLSEICDKIVEADSVCLVGSGDMHTVATAAHIQFLQASGKFCCYNDMAVLEVAIRHMNEKSVVVFFSYTGEVSETVEIARLARERGAYIVTVTRFKDSTLASLSDGVLLCEIHKADYQFTSVPILAGFRFAADLLYVGYRQKSKTEIADF